MVEVIDALNASTIVSVILHWVGPVQTRAIVCTHDKPGSFKSALAAVVREVNLPENSEVTLEAVKSGVNRSIWKPAPANWTFGKFWVGSERELGSAPTSPSLDWLS
jgi:hypothetical protein